MSFQAPSWISKTMVLSALVALLLVGTTGPAVAGTWFKAATGWSGMAMDDINNGDFRFYDYTIEGYNFPDLNSGFSLSLHVGHDFSPDFSLGFSWDHQYARVSGKDVDVTADLNLDANFYMGHLYWRPLRKDKWEFGAAAGLGFGVPDGKVKITGTNNVNYRQGDIRGSSTLALELMGLVNFSLSEKSSLELTVGWRDATIEKIEVDKQPVEKEDGTRLALDYTGYIIKVGYKYVFAD